MKALKIKIKKKAYPEILERDASMNSQERIEAEVKNTYDLTTNMLHLAMEEIDEILNGSTEAIIIERWLCHKQFVRYFGKEEVNIKQIKLVRKRLKRAYKRLSEKKVKITLVSETIFFSKYKGSYALNGGFILSPNSFMLLPNWFKKNKEGKAGTYIHELFHDIFGHQKVEDVTGEKVEAVSNRTAIYLAMQNPKKARRNPENYEQFCEALWGAHPVN